MPLKGYLIDLSDAVSAVCSALQGVRDANKSFDDRTKGGARLVRSTEQAKSIAESARHYINRMRAIRQESVDLEAAAQGKLFGTLFEDCEG